jgi:hypothetical protein
MPPENYYITKFTFSMDELKDVFPWFESLGMEIEKPKSKRGRKPKAHRASEQTIEMKEGK